MANKISEEVRGHKSGVRAELISHNEPHLWPSRGQDSAPNIHMSELPQGSRWMRMMMIMMMMQHCERGDCDALGP